MSLLVDGTTIENIKINSHLDGAALLKTAEKEKHRVLRQRSESMDKAKQNVALVDDGGGLLSQMIAGTEDVKVIEKDVEEDGLQKDSKKDTDSIRSIKSDSKMDSASVISESSGNVTEDQSESSDNQSKVQENHFHDSQADNKENQSDETGSKTEVDVDQTENKKEPKLGERYEGGNCVVKYCICVVFFFVNSHKMISLQHIKKYFWN